MGNRRKGKDRSRIGHNLVAAALHAKAFLATGRVLRHLKRMTRFSDAARQTTTALRALFPETPLQRNDHLSARYGAEIFLKREDLSPVRSYKLRGAFNAMRKVRARQPDQREFVCASAGNHAQGVAFACRHFGVHGTIFMPVTTPQQKIDKTRIFGGDQITIQLTGDYFDQTLSAAQSYCTEKGAHFLSPFDDPDVIEGQASVAVEMLDQLGRAPDLVILPVGGGGLASGVTGFLREVAPETDFRFRRAARWCQPDRRPARRWPGPPAAREQLRRWCRRRPDRRREL
jgi:threonine dehydratase